MGAFDLLAALTSQLASTTRLDELAIRVVPEIAALGFGLVWILELDEQTGELATLHVVRDGEDVTREMPERLPADPRQPIGHGFRDRRIVNVQDPRQLHVLERDDDVIPVNTLGITRGALERMRGHPFAVGPVLGANGAPIGAVCLASYRGAQPIPDDMLERGPLRAILDLLAIALERGQHAARVARLTERLGQAHATLVADAGIKSVGELAVAMAHDLNNFAGITRIAVDVGSRSPANAVEALPRIDRANRAIGDMVARLRRVSRAGLDAAPGAPANLAQVVDDIVVMMTSQLRERLIEIDAEIPPLPPVRCDATLLLQVVMNLVVNAQDALGDAPVDRRQIQLRAREEAGTVRLTVADTGPGIAPHVLARLFQAGFTTKPGGHMGLGLAASQASLAPFGARLAARNALAGGAVFELVLLPDTAKLADDPARLPVAVAFASPVASASASPVASGKASSAARHARILAVDDDPDIVDLILAYLEPLGHAIATATTSAHALALAAQQTFDLVLCDVGMPKQSGIEVARALRAAGYRGKIVLMTGWDTPSLSSDVRECDQLLAKPFVGGDLIAVIEALLR